MNYVPTIEAQRAHMKGIVDGAFTRILGVSPHKNTDYEKRFIAVKFLVSWFKGQAHDENEDFECFMERITGNYGRPEPVDSILKDYPESEDRPALTEEIINAILEAIDNA